MTLDVCWMKLDVCWYVQPTYMYNQQHVGMVSPATNLKYRSNPCTGVKFDCLTDHSSYYTYTHSQCRSSAVTSKPL